MEVKLQGQLRQKEALQTIELAALQPQAPWKDTNCWELPAASKPALADSGQAKIPDHLLFSELLELLFFSFFLAYREALKESGSRTC